MPWERSAGRPSRQEREATAAADGRGARRDGRAGARNPGGLLLLRGYARRSPLVRLVPFLLLAACAFLVSFGSLVLVPDVQRLMELRAQVAVATEEAAAQEAMLDTVQAAAAQRDELRRQVEAAEARLLPAAGLSGLAVRLDGYARNTGATLLAVQFGAYAPLARSASGGEAGGEVTRNPGSPAGGVAEPAPSPSPATGAPPAPPAPDWSERSASPSPAAPGAGDPASYGSVAVTVELEGTWNAIEGWFRRVAEAEPALWVERVSLAETGAGLYEARLSGRVWVKGTPPDGGPGLAGQGSFR